MNKPDDPGESANRLFMVRFVRFINTADEKLADELVSPLAVFHVPTQAEPLRGPAGYLALIGMMRSGFPDIQWTLEDAICEGGKVAARFTMRGTHTGSWTARSSKSTASRTCWV